MSKEYNIHKFDIIDSTNDYLQRLLYSNECEFNKKYLVISKSQTNGHGSKGRSFLSEKDVGIYFSLLLFYENNKLNDNNLDINDFISYLTPNVCVSIKKCIKELFDIDLSIKWINDLYLNNKKVVGILCKHFPDKNAIVVGIGIDLYENKNLVTELKDIVGYIFDDKIEESAIENLIISITDDIVDGLYIGKIKEDYFDNNLVIDKMVKIDGKLGKAISINEKGHLMIDIAGSIQEIDSVDVEIYM